MYLILLEKDFQKDMADLKKDNPKLPSKVWDLIFDILKTPYTGIGKPEELKHNLAGWWSRRVNQKHRLIYKIDNETLILLSCYDHYEDK